MRIYDTDGSGLRSVYLALSEAEAAELSEALSDLASATVGWHAHIAAADQQTEFTVFRDDDKSAGF